MIRSAARTLLMLLLVGSLGLTGWTLNGIIEDPLLRPLVERTGAEIVAATDRAMAEAATPARIEARLAGLVAEEKRNWLAIDAVLEAATERGMAVSPGLSARLSKARAADTGFFTTAGSCAVCAYDPSQCELSGILLCQAPMVLTPLGDLAGVVRESANYVLGSDVDEIDLILSVVGLAAVGLVVATGGSSGAVKIGASMGKLARKMGLLSPRLTAMLTDAARRGVDWARLPSVRSGDDLAGLLRPAVIAPAVEVLKQTGRLHDALGVTRTLHVLRYVDDARDARRLGNAAEALGPRMVGRLEVLGKSRFLRATMKQSDTLWALLTGFLGLAASLVSMAGSVAASLATWALRRAARRV